MRLHVKLREVLQERGITQKELSHATGIYPNAVSSLCRDEGTVVNKQYLGKIAEVLDIKDIRELLEIR